MAACPHCGKQFPRKSKYPQFSIITRKHPLGFNSPSGKRQVRAMSLVFGADKQEWVRVEVIHNGYQAGWTFPLKEYTEWITFNIEGSSQPFGIGSAWAYWQKHSGPSE
jgi:hypothetical protein